LIVLKVENCYNDVKIYNIAAILVPGRWLNVQLLHYRRSSGKQKYAVKFQEILTKNGCKIKARLIAWSKRQYMFGWRNYHFAALWQ